MTHPETYFALARAVERSRVSLIARCVSCKHEADVTDATDQPFCPKCGSPMVAVKATKG